MIITRRSAAAASAAAAAFVLAPRVALGQAPAGPFVQAPLPFSEVQLAPTISARTVALHHGRHARLTSRL